MLQSPNTTVHSGQPVCQTLLQPAAVITTSTTNNTTGYPNHGLVKFHRQTAVVVALVLIAFAALGMLLRVIAATEGSNPIGQNFWVGAGVSTTMISGIRHSKLRVFE
jgi:hypothetical protein